MDEAPNSASRADLRRALREAGWAGLLALALFMPLIGFNTVQNIRNELVLETRWPLLASLVVIIAAARFLQSLVIAPWLARRALRVQHAPASGPWARLTPWLSSFAIGFAAAYPFIVLMLSGFQGGVKWIDNFGMQILIYVMLGFGLNIVVGLAGLLDLGYVAFYAVGAYSYALLAKTFGLSFWLLLPLAGCLAAFWGMLLGFPVLRLRGDYLAIVTLAFGEIIRLVLINWVPVTNGYAGISGIPRPTFFGIPFNANDDGFAAVFGLEFTPDLPHHLSLLPDPRARAAHRLRHAAAAPAADRARLGGAARRRDRLPLARHQHHQHQAHRVRDRRDVRGLRRLVLRRAAGLHLAGELHLHGIGGDRRDRRARRHGQPDRRRDRRRRS